MLGIHESSVTNLSDLNDHQLVTTALENKTDKVLQLHEASILVGGNTIKAVVIKHVYSAYSVNSFNLHKKAELGIILTNEPS